jgi:hypothetical protein
MSPGCDRTGAFFLVNPADNGAVTCLLAGCRGETHSRRMQ